VQQLWSLNTWSRGQFRQWFMGVQVHPQKFWFVKNPGKISKNLRKIPQNLGTDASAPLFPVVRWRRLSVEICPNLTFSFPKYTWFLCGFQKNVLIISESEIFRVSLSKFGQKYFALPKICLPLLLVLSRPISASLSLEGFRSHLGLEDYRSLSQTYCLETLNTSTIWFSKTCLFQLLRSWNTFCLFCVQVRYKIQ